MEHIAVSVIVPIYNTKPWLEECVQSILAQKASFPEPYEVILVDDGATDGCGELCDALAARDDRIRVIHQAFRLRATPALTPRAGGIMRLSIQTISCGRTT